MRYSALFGKSTKTDASDAQLVSHKLLVKGGFVRRLSTGRWSYLPLGYRVCEKVMQIIDEEMKALGVQRMEVPTLQPIEIWQASNRDKAFGSEMLVVEDHHGATFAIGATAEGAMAETVKMFSPSYKDLPIEVYQFSQKFRDDKRPRGGLMRVREFMMKDAYTFASDEKQFAKSYEMYFQAYLKIAKKLGIKVIPLEADSGAIGGSTSHEFMVESKDGDNTFVVCDKCSYSANLERAEFKRVKLNEKETEKKLEVISQPEWVNSMQDNVKHYGQPLWRYLKNVVYKDSNGKLYIASVRGDQEVNEIKLKRALDKEDLTPAEDKDLAKIGTKHGSVHSWGIKGVTYIGDLGLPMVKNYIGGHKEEKTDTINVNYGRELDYKLADIADAKEGDWCSRCQGGKLSLKKGFEWGHCFNIGHFYSKPQKCNFTDKDGKDKPLWMGSYGIGLGRSIACIVEQNHDDNGIVWPSNVAPFDYYLIALGQEEEIKKQAENVYEQLSKKGKQVLFDDRDVSAGEKFADADLLGIPVRLVISAKTNGRIEVKQRDKKENKIISLESLLSI